MKRILGLDTGTNSLGWAVVDKHEDGLYNLIRKGSLVFQEGVKIEKGIESSKAAERTEHRALRKQYFRRRLRKIEVLKVLTKYNLCPKLTDEELNLWHTKKIYPKNDDFMLWQRTSDNENKNPYYYRHVCLHEVLDLEDKVDAYILGRAMYHLAQRRGFLSNRLDNSDDSDESGKVKEGISALSDDISNAGYEYLGDYFYSLYDSDEPKKIRSRYTDREEHYKKEFYAICDKQQLPTELINELERALYFQRPLKSQRQGVGKCTMEKGKPRCAGSHPDFEEYRMWSLLNNVKVQGPYDLDLRPLSADDVIKALPQFFRKSKSNFEFEDIAKAVAGKGKFQNIKDEGDKPYKFNYRMSQSVSGCPTIAQLRDIFGEDWRNGIAESYTLNTKTDGSQKSVDEMVNDVWNVLYSFSSDEKLVEFGKTKLQLDEERAKKFSKIKLSKGFASLSLKAVRKILPFLREGYIYSHAVFFANIPTIIGRRLWERDREDLLSELSQYMDEYSSKDKKIQGTIESCIKDILANRYDLMPGAIEKLYHPSMIETYEDAKMINGIYQLGSPRTNAIRNPMAMRSLHQIRKVVNLLLKEKVIDQATEVHVEYARELNDANMRQAIADYNKDRETKRKGWKDEIKKLYKEETGKDIEPTEDDILRFQLREEQEGICLYTGLQIGIADCIGPNPTFDIEHTIPRSVGGDYTQMNLTLCESRFNREVKKAQLPSQLSNHDDIMERISSWKERIETLTKEIDRIKRQSRASTTKESKDRVIRKRHLKELERDYWRGKYERFTMKEVPEGFARRQGAGIGLVSKYAGLYLKSLFHDKYNRNHSHVYVVKGAATAEFRKMWGIQNEYEKKSRDNHVHHCIDAITIACIGLDEYNKMAEFYRQDEYYRNGVGSKPQFSKPWPTFAEDMKNLEKSMLVVHNTPDNMPKRARKRVKTSKGEFIAQGDSARGSLHMDTYYGAIEHDGEVRYVVRRPISSFTSIKDLDVIVDDAVRETIIAQIGERTFKDAINAPLYMNKEKGILIKKVRCYANSVKSPINIRQHRDKSKKEYKQQYHVANDTNYMIAIYEEEVKGKIKRDYKIIRSIDAAYDYSAAVGCKGMINLAPHVSGKGFPLKTIIRVGNHVILYENTPEEIDIENMSDITKRLYKVTGISLNPVGNGYGQIVMRHHQEARCAKDIKIKNGAFKNGEEYRASILMLHTQFNALVEGLDFEINELGEIKLL